MAGTSINATVEKSIEIKISEIKTLIKLILLKIVRLKNKQNKDWGHVGSLTRIKQDLEEINEFLN